MPIVCRIVALATIASAICSSPAWAQYGVPIPRSKKSQRQPPKLKEIDGKAVIGAVGHRVLGVTLRKKTWLVRIAPGTHVEVRGYAELNYLKPGQIVRFLAEVDKAGEVAAPLEELDIVTLLPGESIGTFADDIDAPPGTRAVPEGEHPLPLEVVGRVASIDGNDLIVSAGQLKVHAKIEPDATIHFFSTDHRLARPGDQVEVKGIYFERGAMLARRLTISLANLLEDPRKAAELAAQDMLPKPEKPNQADPPNKPAALNQPAALDQPAAAAAAEPDSAPKNAGPDAAR